MIGSKFKNKLFQSNVKYTQMESDQYQFNTRLGSVLLLKKNIEMPPGYRLLTQDQCYWIANELYEVARETIGYKECSLANGTFKVWGSYFEINQQINNLSEYSIVLCPQPGSVDVTQLEYYTQLIKKHQFALLPIGLVLRIPLNQQIPGGFRPLKIDQGKQFKGDLIKYVVKDEWAIVAFQTGKLTGWGYGNEIHETYGSECGELFVISIAPI